MPLPYYSSLVIFYSQPLEPCKEVGHALCDSLGTVDGAADLCQKYCGSHNDAVVSVTVYRDGGGAQRSGCTTTLLSYTSEWMPNFSSSSASTFPLSLSLIWSLAVSVSVQPWKHAEHAINKAQGRANPEPKG